MKHDWSEYDYNSVEFGDLSTYKSTTKNKNPKARYSIDKQKHYSQHTKTKLGMKSIIQQECIYCNKINRQTFAKNDDC